MTGFLCLVFSHRWAHVADVLEVGDGGRLIADAKRGLWQCTRCARLEQGETLQAALRKACDADALARGTDRPPVHPNGAGGFDPLPASNERAPGETMLDFAQRLDRQSAEAAARAEIARLQRHMNPPGL
jgi:hypothetical protein